ncbi:hypothetical protein GF420_13975 [candidate division GN15 bacterium]|nr:hypothetical protein [candidate division GN15 bacterium]
MTTAKAKDMSPEEMAGKWVIGTLHENNEITEFCDEYDRLVDRVNQGRR